MNIINNYSRKKNILQKTNNNQKIYIIAEVNILKKDKTKKNKKKNQKITKKRMKKKTTLAMC